MVIKPYDAKVTVLGCSQEGNDKLSHASLSNYIEQVRQTKEEKILKEKEENAKEPKEENL